MLTLLAALLAATPDDAVIRALSPRHDPPSCAALEVGLADPVATWTRLAESTPAAPWVAPRAARCLLAHPEAAERAAARWFADPALAGLADVALVALPSLPSGPDLLRQAFAGPHADRIQRRIAADPALAAALAAPARP
jgi:hypothetical protein